MSPLDIWLRIIGIVIAGLALWFMAGVLLVLAAHTVRAVRYRRNYRWTKRLLAAHPLFDGDDCGCRLWDGEADRVCHILCAEHQKEAAS